MKEVAAILLVAALLVAGVGFGLWRETTRWNDCRAANRPWIVCILMLGH